MSPRRVLLTGGSRGIGRATVSALVEAGYQVDFVFGRATKRAEELVAQLGSERVHALQCDLGDAEAVELLAARLEGGAAPYYAMVHNAAISADALGASINLTQAGRLMQVNLWSFARLLKSVVRPMLRARSGRVVVISSVAGSLGSRGNAAYAASKAALEAYCRCLVDEMAAKGLTFNMIAPGWIDTELLEGKQLESIKDSMLKRIPARRVGSPADVANLVRFLLAGESSYVNGATLVVDGGLSATLGMQ